MLLRALRIDAGLTQFGLAVRAGVTEKTVARIENGSHGPNAQTRERIASALGMSITDISWPERVRRSTTGNDIRGAALIGVRGDSPDHQGV